MTTATPQTTEAQTPPAPSRMTWEEFLAWVDEDSRAEWINGEIEVHSPASGPHQDIVGLLYTLLRTFLQQARLGRVWMAPMLMRLPEKPSGREPDLLVLLQEHMDRYRETYIDGPADLVIEVVSEESQDRDRSAKFAEYEAAGIPEYWLIDPRRRYADFYCLDEDGLYRRVDLDTEDRFFCAALPGLFVKPEWFWRADDIGTAEVVTLVQTMLP